MSSISDQSDSSTITKPGLWSCVVIHAIQGCAFLPLSTVVGAERAKQMIQNQKEKIKARMDAGELSKGLQAQYMLQLERLESDNNGDCELILFPGSIVPGRT